MDIIKTNEEKYADAKAKVRKVKMFYIHLLGYIVAAGLIIYNFIIIEDVPLKNTILAVNTSSLVIWGIVIAIHGWITFKGRILFSKKWEERKVKEYMNRDKQI